MPGKRENMTSQYMKDMYKAEFESEKEVPTKYQEIYKVVSGVKGAGDKATQLLGMGRLTRHEVEGQEINFKAPVQGWEFLVKYQTYSEGISLTKEAVEDNVKTGDLLKSLAGTWGKQVRIAKEELAARPFNRGGDLLGDWVFNGTHAGNTDSSGNLAYDSKPLFNLTGNKRTTKGGGTYYNSVASLALSSSSDFQTLYVLHTSANNRDERDEICQNPADTLLTKTGADSFLAKQLLKSQLFPNSDKNNINPYEDILSHISWDYLDPLAAENAFFVGKKQHPDFQFHERQLPEIMYFRDQNNGGYKASITLRIGVWIKNFRAWSRGGGTSA